MRGQFVVEAETSARFACGEPVGNVHDLVSCADSAEIKRIAIEECLGIGEAREHIVEERPAGVYSQLQLVESNACGVVTE